MAALGDTPLPGKGLGIVEFLWFLAGQWGDRVTRSRHWGGKLVRGHSPHLPYSSVTRVILASLFVILSFLLAPPPTGTRRRTHVRSSEGPRSLSARPLACGRSAFVSSCCVWRRGGWPAGSGPCSAGCCRPRTEWTFQCDSVVGEGSCHSLFSHISTSCPASVTRWPGPSRALSTLERGSPWPEAHRLYGAQVSLLLQERAHGLLPGPLACASGLDGPPLPFALPSSEWTRGHPRGRLHLLGSMGSLSLRCPSPEVSHPRRGRPSLSLSSLAHRQ